MSEEPDWYSDKPDIFTQPEPVAPGDSGTLQSEPGADKSFLQQLQNGDVCSFLFVAVLVFYGGSMLSSNNHRARRLGIQVGAVVLIGFCSWQLFDSTQAATHTLPSIIIRGLIYAAIAAGLTWISAPVIDAVVSTTTSPFRAANRGLQNAKYQREARRREREEARQAAIREKEREQTRRIEAVERARTARAEAEIRERQQRQSLVAAKERQQRRAAREEVRFDCQLLYERMTPEQKEQFPESRFHGYFDKFLDESVPLDVMKTRAQQLRSMLEECFNPMANHVQTGGSVQEIHERFEQKRAAIKKLGYEPAIEEALLFDLRSQEYEEITKATIA